MLLNYMANSTKGHAGPDQANGLVEALLSNLDEAFGMLRGIADTEHLAGVTVISLVDDGDIDINNIAALEDLGIAGNAVAYDMVYRRTY